ncbi:MAG: hypothetical protein KDC71_05770 [Acidobacteria bacterium]|nr:hypothetical protein [Acidobacteriota bacterium]
MNQNSFNLDEVELHSDVQIHRAPESEPPPHRGHNIPVWIWILIVLLLGGLGWFIYQTQELKGQLHAIEAGKAEVDTTLTQKETDLDKANQVIIDLQKQVAGLKTDGDKSKKQAQSLEKELKTSQSSLTDKDKKLAEVEKDLNASKKAESDLKKQVSQLTDSLTLKTEELNRKAQTFEQTTSELNGKIGELEKNYRTLEGRNRDLQKQVDEERERYRQESAASLNIIKERSNLIAQNQDLTSENTRLKRELDNKTQRIQALETVQEGQLVPYNTDLIPGEITYREPLVREGVPRRYGPFAVQVLISEVGSVKNAFIVPGQEIESGLARAILENTKLWKFSPPSLQGKRVQTWQTVIVSSN